jgi:hypothetical protein
MYPPGFYKTNNRALRFRELLRWYGLKQGIRNYLKSYFVASVAAGWMPGLWAEMECKPEKLSEEFWQATKPHRKEFEDLGFTACHLLKPRTLSPSIRDNGGIAYLDASRSYFGQVLFHRFYHRATDKEINGIVIAFTAVFEGGSFSCTNAKRTFDPSDDAEVIRLNSYDVKFIHQQFLQGLQRLKKTPRQFPDLESLRQWFDARQVRVFEERVRRGLFVLMTEQEVAVAQARLQSAPTAGLPVYPPRFKFRWALWLAIIGCIVVLEFFRHQIPHGDRHGRSGTLEYQGQEFKMRKAYDSYEDYKDDPNNLDTNELDRIEQVMTTTKVLKSFRSWEEFSGLMINMEFPGYGAGGIGEEAKTDDGSVLHVETVEIPQRNKDRVFVVRRVGEGFILVDDFVYSTATNQIRDVKLEKQRLRYYDERKQLIREKQL